MLTKVAPALHLKSAKSAKPQAAPAAASVATGAVGVRTGTLNGKVLFTSGGHGYVWRPPGYDASQPNGFWGIMRSYGYNFMEDMGNQDQIQPYADYGLHAGATVVAMRPVGHQVNEVVMDDAMGYSASTGGVQVMSGTWSKNTSTTPYWSINNGNDADHWQFASASATETAVIRYTPNIPAAGFYPVYAWTNPGTDNSANDRMDDQTYRINFTGGSEEVRVAQDKVGNGWIYLGTYYFAQGVSGANVEISNKTSGTTAGKYAVADGIRFGNGMGDWTGNGTHPVSGYSREDEAAVYWCYDSLGWTGNGTRVSQNVVNAQSSLGSLADENINFFACDRYAAYMNNSHVGARDERLWISFHSNGSGSAGTGGTGRGTYGLITGSPTTNQLWLAETAGLGVQTDMLGLGYGWAVMTGAGNPNSPNNNVYGPGGGYSEISNGSTYINGEFDATIVEVAFHDNETDNFLLKNPQVRWDVGRSAYHSAVRYFQQFDGLANATLLPEAPVNVRATADAGGTVTVSWTPGPSSNGTGGPYGNAATSYLVHTSGNGYGFDGGVSTAGTSMTFSGLSTTAPTYFQVTAVNAGGESLGSYVVAAKPQSNGSRSPVLIVNGFNQLDASEDQPEVKSFGTVYRARARYNNSFDYGVQAAQSLTDYNANLGFDEAPASAVSAGLINLSDYQAVIWMGGEQGSHVALYSDPSKNLASNFVSFDANMQSAITTYLGLGGKLFLTGSNIAWDLSSSGGNHGATFLTNTLHASYVRDSAGTHAFKAGVAGTALAGVAAGSFEDGTHGTYDVDSPDGISAAGTGATAALSYSGGSGGTAAIQWAGGNARLVFMAVPVESVYTTSTRDAVVSGVMNYFGFSSTGLPVTTPQPGTPDLADGSDHGPSNTDNVTNLNNSSAGTALVFTVPSTVAGATVQLFADGVLVGQAVATGTSTTIVTDGTVALSNATHTFSAVQTNPGAVASLGSAGLAVTIDAVAPTASIAAVNNPRSTPLTQATVSFSEGVYGFNLADVALSRDGGTVTLGAAGQTLSNVGNTYTLAGLGAVTTNAGTYALSLPAGGTSGITDLAGNALANNPSVGWVMNTILGTTGNDAITVARDSADAGVVRVTVNGSTYSLNLAGLGDLTVSSDDGDDVLTLDWSAGQPALDAGHALTYLSGGAATRDALVVIGTAGDDAAALTDSTVVVNGGPTVSYFTGAVSPIAVAFNGGTGNDALTVTNKAIGFAADAAGGTANLTLNLGNGASAVFGASQHLAALNLSGNATASVAAGGNKVLVTGTLVVGGTARLDLADEDLIVRSGMSADQMRQYLKAGQVFSSVAVGNTALGYATAGDVGASAFDGESVGTGAAVLVKYTYKGDTDLDGVVTADDLARVDRGAAFAVGSWVNGDSDYDGDVDGADVAAAMQGFGGQGEAL